MHNKDGTKDLAKVKANLNNIRLTLLITTCTYINVHVNKQRSIGKFLLNSENKSNIYRLIFENWFRPTAP